jgi:AcrR family transcriptional regulator
VFYQKGRDRATSFAISTVFEMSDEKQAALPPPPWQRVPERGKRKRRDPLTQEAIVEAAIKVLDAEGLAGFSMRRVADELNTGAASLYWHVGSKDGLFDLIFEEVIGEQLEGIPDADPERWQEQLKEVARAMRRTILRHRDIVQLSIGRIPMGPNALRMSERVLAILRSGGVPDELAAQSYLLMISAVNGFTMDEAGYDAQAPEGAPPADEAAQMVKTYFSSLPDDQFSNLKEVAEHFAITDQDARFDLLIDLFVDGISARAASES